VMVRDGRRAKVALVMKKQPLCEDMCCS